MGATSSAECTLLGCDAGEQPNAAGDACEPCPLGTFQPNEYSLACLECADGTSTKEPGQTSGSACEGKD